MRREEPPGRLFKYLTYPLQLLAWSVAIACPTANAELSKLCQEVLSIAAEIPRWLQKVSSIHFIVSWFWNGYEAILQASCARSSSVLRWKGMGDGR